MTALPSPNPALRQAPYEPAEIASDADPVRTGIFEHGDGSMVNYVPPGSVAEQLGRSRVPLTTAQTEGTAASADQRNWGSYGAANEPSMNNRPGV